MELKRKTIELIEVSPEFCLDTLYANTAYDTPFVIGDDVFNGLSDFVHPKDVAFIEVR